MWPTIASWIKNGNLTVKGVALIWAGIAIVAVCQIRLRMVEKAYKAASAEISGVGKLYGPQTAQLAEELDDTAKKEFTFEIKKKVYQSLGDSKARFCNCEAGTLETIIQECEKEEQAYHQSRLMAEQRLARIQGEYEEKRVVLETKRDEKSDDWDKIKEISDLLMIPAIALMCVGSCLICRHWEQRRQGSHGVIIASR